MITCEKCSGVGYSLDAVGLMCYCSCPMGRQFASDYARTIRKLKPEDNGFSRVLRQLESGYGKGEEEG